MPIPLSVDLIGQGYTIAFVPGSDPRLAGSKDIDNVGVARIAAQELVIANDIGFDQERDTVLHEILHAFVGVLGFAVPGLEGEAVIVAEERVVGCLAPLLLHLVRANPDLIAYLQELEP